MSVGSAGEGRSPGQYTPFSVDASDRRPSSNSGEPAGIVGRSVSGRIRAARGLVATLDGMVVEVECTLVLVLVLVAGLMVVLPRTNYCQLDGNPVCAAYHRFPGRERPRRDG
jgi:hypothetical protein